MEKLTTRAYWDGVWRHAKIPQPLDPHSTALKDFGRRQWDQYLRRMLGRTNLLCASYPVRLLEVGCGGSVLLPYFYKEFNFSVSGLDYSAFGCAKSRAIHEAARVPAEIYHGDMFDPPSQLQSQFDLVCSFGLIEHFRPPEEAITAISRFCRPGGYLLTTVPNLRGMLGAIQKAVNPPVYELHAPMSVTALAAAHSRSGLEVIEASPFGTINLMVVNFSGSGSRIPETLGLGLTACVSRTFWALHKLGLPERASAFTAPYLGCLAKLPLAVLRGT